MKWEKMGKIFDPTDYNLAHNCIEYAQSPNALVFDDFIRIYFSSRKIDSKGKYLSVIFYIDINKDFSKVINISNHNVIELGDLGCFDEHGIFPMNVLRKGKKIFAYTCGWNRRVSVSVDTSIGFAISENDGHTFKKLGNGPILSSSLNEPFLVGDPFVQVFDGVFHMFYIFGVKWKMYSGINYPERIYKLGHATSKDGIHWKKDNKQIVQDKYIDESQANPTVIHINNKYHIFFGYRHSSDFRVNKERGYRIGYAFSYDLKNWIRDDANLGLDLTKGTWDSDMMCYPNVFSCDDNVYMLYNGNEFGRYGFGLAKLIQ